MKKKKSAPAKRIPKSGARQPGARNAKKRVNKNTDRVKGQINTKKVLPILVCSLLGLLIVFGIVLGTIAIVKEAKSVVSYRGVRVDKGVAAYLASTYKAAYKGDKDDTAALDAAIEQYIRRIVVAAYLYDRTSKLDEFGKQWIENNVNEVLEYKAEGSIAVFNKQAEPMGFNFKDFKRGTELIYKATSALDAIYGANGSRLSYADADTTRLCEEYFAGYTHIKILFIRTETKYALTDEGDRMPNGDGTDMTIGLTPEAKAARLEDIARITELVENTRTGVGSMMSLEELNYYYEKYNDEPAYAESGYYLHPNSDFTAYLEGKGGYPNLTKTALSMNIGDWAKTTDGEVVCFIYRYAPLSPDYADSDMYRFFTDFYSDAAEHFFMRSVDEIAPDVKVKDKYHKLGLSGLKKNPDFKIWGVGIGLDW